MTMLEIPAQGSPDQGPKDEFALVCYLPGALGGFLDRLRTELVPECAARSHVTLLPPRPLHGRDEGARRQLQRTMPSFHPFVVELGEVAVFQSSKVIYLELLCGQKDLKGIHQVLNSEDLHYDEPYPYHPHVTLAQGPTVVEDADEKLAIARVRWQEFRLPRRFVLDTVMFVQNGGPQGWLDLDELAVGANLAESVP
jgi:2'-5' RNA ligase